MEITTKLKIEDFAWTIHENKVLQFAINNIKILIDTVIVFDSITRITYSSDEFLWFAEELCFATKVKLLASL